MPLQLLDYSQMYTTGDKRSNSSSILLKRYRDFGNEIIAHLRDGLKHQIERGEEVYECTLMSDLRVMKRLLGNQYSVTCIPVEREIPRKLLIAKMQTKRRTCILLGVTRFFVIRENILP